MSPSSNASIKKKIVKHIAPLDTRRSFCKLFYYLADFFRLVPANDNIFSALVPSKCILLTLSIHITLCIVIEFVSQITCSLTSFFFFHNF